MSGSRMNDVTINLGRLRGSQRHTRTVIELQPYRIFVRLRTLESALVYGYSPFYHLGKLSFRHPRVVSDYLKAKERMTLTLWKKRGLKLKQLPKPRKSFVDY